MFENLFEDVSKFAEDFVSGAAEKIKKTWEYITDADRVDIYLDDEE